jgi:hypothetical protein
MRIDSWPDLELCSECRIHLSTGGAAPGVTPGLNGAVELCPNFEIT